jgi:hypothetical protein
MWQVYNEKLSKNIYELIRPIILFSELIFNDYSADKIVSTIISRISVYPGEMNRGYEKVHAGINGHTAARTVIALGVFITVFAVIAVQPALAQENPVCQEDSETLINMIEGFVQLTTGLGVMGLLVVWQADSLLEMFTLSQEQQASLKQHKRSAMKSASTLILLGPLFTLAGSMMDLPIATCVDLIPF